MKKLINELESCIENKLYWSALNIALLIPDVCGAINSPNGQAKGKKYVGWFDKYIINGFPENVNSWDFYNLRCASLHQGKLNHDKSRFKRILFQLPDKFGNRINFGTFNEITISINLEFFVENIISGFNLWYEERANIPFVAKNIENSIQYRENGLPPYIVGLPVFY